jgi:hypothetical protein
MSRVKRNHQADLAANGAWDRARRAAAQVKPVRLEFGRLPGAPEQLRGAARTKRATAAPQAERMA